VTSLGSGGVGFVDAFNAGYAAFLEEWRHEILVGLATERPGDAHKT
jgi:hypothetical protein